MTVHPTENQEVGYVKFLLRMTFMISCLNPLQKLVAVISPLTIKFLVRLK